MAVGEDLPPQGNRSYDVVSIMDDVLYDTSLTLYAVTETTAPLTALLEADQHAFDTNALKLRDHLSSGRARYEDEEEHEKIGGLRDCTWEHLRLEDQDPHGLAISLLYDKITYRFIFYASSPRPSARQRKQQRSPASLPLLLIKASTSLTARFLAFLTLHFQSPTIQPVKLPTSHLSSTLSNYITSLVTAHRPIAADHALQTFLQDTIGAIKLTITITAAEIAKNLRTIDIDVPPETLFQLLDTNNTATQQPQNSSAPTPQTFLANLQHHIHQRTGLILPLTPAADPSTTSTATATTTTTGNPTNDANSPTVPTPPPPSAAAAEAPLKLTRLSTTAFALSSDPAGRLKLAARAVQAVEAIPGLDSGVGPVRGNVVRLANMELLRGLVGAAAAAAAAAAAGGEDDSGGGGGGGGGPGR